MTVKRVLIVGGGIAGRSLAVALRGGPWQVELVERDPGRSPLGAGLAVQPNAMRALYDLGVGAAVEEAGAAIHRFEYRDQQGSLLCDIDLDDLWGGLAPFVGITRSRLHNALLDHAPSERRRSATSVRQQNGQVSVTFDDATVVDYDLVIGADGINSAMRHSGIDHCRPVYGGQMVWRSIAPVTSASPHAVQLWLGRDRFFGLCPVGAGLTYGFGNITGARFRDPTAGRRQRLGEAFADFGAPVRDYLTAIADDQDIHCSPIEWLPNVAWRNGRLVLIGDAAHAMPPMMGQGGCMAIEDALALGNQLRRADNIATALDTFVARRAPRINWVRQQSLALTNLIQLPVDVRNHGLQERGTRAFYDRYRPLTDPA
ncbi:FAD-dependent monooxygenase [Kribbella turkmenica]|nr:FAD-dependent monooxygenase [Kribbella turkmenica]